MIKQVIINIEIVLLKKLYIYNKFITLDNNIPI